MGTLYVIDCGERPAQGYGMARMARVVAAGIPHHVTQRGNRRQKVFFGDSGYETYRALLAEGCRKAGVEVLGYCLMPNHVL